MFELWLLLFFIWSWILRDLWLCIVLTFKFQSVVVGRYYKECVGNKKLDLEKNSFSSLLETLIIICLFIIASFRLLCLVKRFDNFSHFIFYLLASNNCFQNTKLNRTQVFKKIKSKYIGLVFWCTLFFKIGTSNKILINKIVIRTFSLFCNRNLNYDYYVVKIVYFYLS